MSHTVIVPTDDGILTAYVARPSRALAPAIIVVHEIFGVNAGIREIADYWAEKGFIAICPEMFWRTDPGLELDADLEPDWERGLALYEAYDPHDGVRDIQAVIDYVRDLPFATGRIGVMGFCLGGLLTFLSAARTSGDAFVSYYGGATEQYGSEAHRITRPLLIHLAGQDEFIDETAQAIIADAVSDNTLVSIRTYPDRHHAFARPGGVHFDAADAALAAVRSEAFFKAFLRDPL